MIPITLHKKSLLGILLFAVILTAVSAVVVSHETGGVLFPGNGDPDVPLPQLVIGEIGLQSVATSQYGHEFSSLGSSPSW